MKIKICGITNLGDALHAVECGADALGFNFYEKSPRYIAPGAANHIIGKLRGHLETVGVFVNSSLDEIHDIYYQTSIKFVQLHGDETPGFAADLRDCGVRIIKALHAVEPVDPSWVDQYKEDELDFVRFLLDTPSLGYGGSGETFDWGVARQFKDVVPEFYLAGGLTPENVVEAIRTVRPTAVDVCSGVEAYKGKKDPKKVAAFIEAVRSVS